MELSNRTRFLSRSTQKLMETLAVSQQRRTVEQHCAGQESSAQESLPNRPLIRRPNSTAQRCTPVQHVSKNCLLTKPSWTKGIVVRWRIHSNCQNCQFVRTLSGRRLTVTPNTPGAVRFPLNLLTGSPPPQRALEDSTLFDKRADRFRDYSSFYQ